MAPTRGLADTPSVSPLSNASHGVPSWQGENTENKGPVITAPRHLLRPRPLPRVREAPHVLWGPGGRGGPWDPRLPWESDQPHRRGSSEGGWSAGKEAAAPCTGDLLLVEGTLELSSEDRQAMRQGGGSF